MVFCVLIVLLNYLHSEKLQIEVPGNEENHGSFDKSPSEDFVRCSYSGIMLHIYFVQNVFQVC